MVAFPHCKINLGLHIVSKRTDGFHNIETCFFPVAWTDILEIIPANQFSFTSSGFPIPGKEEDNLCVKAFKILNDDFKISPVKIHLHKIIPTGAGLGGGSSDAAFTLRILNKIFDLALSAETLRMYAAKLGSDCAFFIEDTPMLGSGRGEQLTPCALNFSGYYLMVIKPNVHVSTAEAYAGVKPSTPKYAIEEVLSRPVEEWSSLLSNDFENSVFEKYPEIKEIKSLLYKHGASYASMSGSGSAVFGFFKKKTEVPSLLEPHLHWADYLA